METPKDVIILGKSPTGSLCPFDGAEIWGVNNVATHLEFVGKQIHKLFAFDILPQEYTDEMKKSAPICSFQPYADIPYPIEEVKQSFQSDFFTNTVSYQIALAGYLKVERVRIYGVDVAFGAPYAQENRGVEYWIGRAQERGVKVEVPKESHLLRTVTGVMYGLESKCNVMMQLHERLNLINMLPQSGKYSDALKSQNAWWVLFPKEDEAKAHGVQVQRQPTGALTFGFNPPTPECPKPGEWLSDVQMPPETWDYVRNLLIDSESKGQLPFGAISIYEKLVLNKERT